MKDFQIEGAPSWVRSERYAIEARAAGRITQDQLRAMLRSLLADRFNLRIRKEARESPVYELLPARGGLKIVPMKPGDCITLTEQSALIPMDAAKPVYVCGGFRRRIVTLPPERTDRVEAGGVSMAWLVAFISEDVGRAVIDRTGFVEPFNVLLDFAPLHQGDLGTGSGPGIFTAVEEQLGLRLRSTTAPLDHLVIERIERPSEN